MNLDYYSSERIKAQINFRVVAQDDEHTSLMHVTLLVTLKSQTSLLLLHFAGTAVCIDLYYIHVNQNAVQMNIIV